MNFIYAMGDQNTKRILQKEFWSYKTNEEDGMAKSIAKFRSLIDHLATLGVVLEKGDKNNAFLSSLPYSWKSFISINGNEQNLSLHMLIGMIL